VHKPPKVEDQEIEILSPEQIVDVRSKLADHSLLPIVELALATGARRGELLGLQWGDVDMEAATLRVERRVEETKAGLRLKSPKTRRGRRTLKVPPETVAMLRAHRKKLLEQRFALGMGNIASETLIFSTVDGGLLSPDNLSRDWCRVRRAKSCRPFHFTRCGTRMFPY
jgi:integrase